MSRRGRDGKGGGELWELFRLFTKLGFVAFGGPAAHVAMMREEVVRRRGWMGDQEFLDLNGATNLIPGPNSTELAIHIGRERAGWRGLVVAGTCFIVPAVLIVLAFAVLYARYGQTPAGQNLLYGITPVVIAIVAQALWGLLKTAIKGWLTGAVGAVALALYLFASVPEIPLLFGSGYVLLAFLRSEFVGPGMLTEQQLVDAVAVGQVTPGPVFTTATFIGYLLEGVPGAALATLGIFLPAFVFVALTGPFIPRLRRSPTLSSLLDGVNVASLALMAGVTWQLGQRVVVDPFAALIGVAALVLLVRFRVSSVWLVIGGGAAGLAVQALFGG